MALVSRGKGQATIVDLTDSRQVVTYLASSNQRQVIYDPVTNKYSPNYATQNNNLIPEIYIAGGTASQLSTVKSVKWYVQTNSIGAYVAINQSDTNYTLESNKSLTIKGNVLADRLSMTYKAEIVYPDPVTKLDIVLIADIELVKISNGSQGEAGVDPTIAILSNESHNIPSNAEGTGMNFFGASTKMSVYKGTEDVTASWVITTQASTGVAGALSAGTYTVTGLTVDSGYVDFTATKSGVTLVKRFTLTKVKQGVSGVDSTVYRVKKSHSVIIRDPEGGLTPNVVYFNSTLLEGNNEKEYKGYYIIYERSSTDPQGTYTKHYESTIAESTIAYHPTHSAIEIRVELHKDKTYIKAVDTEMVMVAEDGEDAYKVEILSTNGNIFKNGIIDTWLYAVVYKGSEDITTKLEASRFRWTKTSADPVADKQWNDKYFGGVKEIKLTTEDVYKRASFECKII